MSPNKFFGNLFALSPTSIGFDHFADWKTDSADRAITICWFKVAFILRYFLLTNQVGCYVCSRKKVQSNFFILRLTWIYFGFDGKYQAITTINHFAQAKCTFFVKAGPRCNFDLLWLLLPIFVFVFLLFLWLCLCLFLCLCLCLWKQAPHSNFNLLSLPSPIFVFAGNFPTTRKLILPS